MPPYPPSDGDFNSYTTDRREYILDKLLYILTAKNCKSICILKFISVFLPHVQEEEEAFYCYERKCILRCSQFFPSWLLLLILPFLPSSVSSPYQITSVAYKQHSPLMPQPTSISVPLLCSLTAKYLKWLSNQVFSTFLLPCSLI